MRRCKKIISRTIGPNGKPGTSFLADVLTVISRPSGTGPVDKLIAAVSSVGRAFIEDRLACAESS